MSVNVSVPSVSLVLIFIDFYMFCLWHFWDHIGHFSQDQNVPLGMRNVRPKQNRWEKVSAISR